MNVTGFSDNENNDSFVGKRSVEQHDFDWDTYRTIRSTNTIIIFVTCSLGIPGNILSAIVWIRRHTASENPSAIYMYLAALAINDLVHLMTTGVANVGYILAPYNNFQVIFLFIHSFTLWLEPLLVLSFSVVRLIAIRRPLQACCIVSRFISTENSAVVEKPRDAQ